jgi:hypothetical protein
MESSNDVLVGSLVFQNVDPRHRCHPRISAPDNHDSADAVGERVLPVPCAFRLDERLVEASSWEIQGSSPMTLSQSLVVSLMKMQ